MFFAALLGVTLVPVLMLLLIRGKITPESKNPVNRFLIWAYQPFVNFVLRFRWLTLIVALLVLAATIYPFSKLGKEFMPPLNEGDILYMPTAVPGMSIDEATKILQIQDRMLRKIPEVERVFGKAGQAETPTDPAPLSMFETVVKLKPPEQWRPGMTWEKLLAEMNANVKTPGMANIFWMPIQTRTEMLTTGFRSDPRHQGLRPRPRARSERRGADRKGAERFSEHPQRLCRAHDRRLFPRLHVEPRSRRALRPDASAT